MAQTRIVVGEVRSWRVYLTFFIGVHVLLRGMTLLTRDARRYSTNFPALKIVAPE